ncbi:MAG: hypothetical protein CM1200mP10_08940 [Candidatus Neomarinimicrobiota bacterium]|nr:MAG: hypothetical protein CM1200mP10_08940 [Candidatus Neomarinimicrobiota bacterium]
MPPGSRGSEGRGVTDVIFGDYNPTGRLSVTWPRTMEQIPINFGDNDYIRFLNTDTD